MKDVCTGATVCCGSEVEISETAGWWWQLMNAQGVEIA
jgi:hypothetical protein